SCMNPPGLACSARAGRARGQAYARCAGSGQAEEGGSPRNPTIGELPMRAAAIDLGAIRVGIAVSDELGILAHPRPYLDGRDPRKVLKSLARLAREEALTCFVVG